MSTNNFRVVIAEGVSEESFEMLRLFFQAVATKFAEAESKHGWDDSWLRSEREQIQNDLLTHLTKGDPRDVAIYCAICHARGWLTLGPK